MNENILEINNTNNTKTLQIESLEEENLKYIFTPITDPSHYSNIFKKENFKTLEKWGLIQNMELVKFRFNLNFELKDLDKFLKDLFNDNQVKINFSPINSVYVDPQKSHSQKNSQGIIENFKFEKLSTRSTNLDIFNTIYDNDICGVDTGYIKKDFDEYFEGIQISDKLKQALLMEESEYYCTFSEQIRKEFLFHIFKRIVVGGSLCQYEDTVFEYLDMTKSFYKDLVSASKDPNSKEIYIRSTVVEIFEIEKQDIFKTKNHPQNFFYVIIDPYQRCAHLWYHKWVSFW
jgi:hypothetical protein